MNSSRPVIRLEIPADYRAVENLTREGFLQFRMFPAAMNTILCIRCAIMPILFRSWPLFWRGTA